MKTMFCWRCRTHVPMFDDAEYSVVHRLFGEGFNATPDYRALHALPAGVLPVNDRFRSLMAWHLEKTGVTDTIPQAIMHHRISLYGPPCTACGKPLRHPEANFCAACGTAVLMGCTDVDP